MRYTPTASFRGKIFQARFIQGRHKFRPSLTLIVLTQEKERKSFQIYFDKPEHVSTDESRGMAMMSEKLVGEKVYCETGMYREKLSDTAMGEYNFLRIESGRFSGIEVRKCSNL